MKVFNLKERVELYGMDILNKMEKEYSFYKKICNETEILKKKYKVCKQVNYQCRTTLACNCSCNFCIERDSCKNNEVKTNIYLNKLDLSLKELIKKEITPSVTITGGEPCLDKIKLMHILDILKNNKIQKFNLNTNGILLNKDIINKIKEVEMPYLNISMHHYDLEKNKNLFGGNGISLEQLKFIKESLGGTYYDKTRVRIQCVLMENEIDNLEEIKKFLNFVKTIGFDNVSFRGLSKLKEEGNKDLHDYCEDKSLDIFSILNNLKNDNSFKFNCQNISDHYIYEDWVYGALKDFYGMDVHFAYSDMDILEKRERAELENNELYAREFVLYEDGLFCGGWNKEIKSIK